MAAAPAGTTIRLRTNALIPIPDSLTVTKALNLEPAKGFHPKIGRTGTAAALVFQVPGRHARRLDPGITFRQVKLTVMYSTGTHRTVFSGNTIRLDTGAIGDGGFAVFYLAPSKGSVSVRSNDVSSSGTGLGVAAGAGTVEIVGNRITAPALATSQMGLYFAAGSGVVRGTVASNVIHHTSGCGCPTNSAMLVGASGSARLNVGILNNTVANLGLNPTGGAIGILVSNPTAPAKVNARLYNNVVANVFGAGFAVLNDADTTAAGDRNNSYAISAGDVIGSYPMGTILHRQPKFVSPGAGNYRLKSSSKLANAGAACVAGYPIPRADAADRFRYFGAGIDLGAYERGSTVLGSAAA